MSDEALRNEDKINAARSVIEQLYQRILLRPDTYCRGVSIETYILAFEHVLDLLYGLDRPDRYTTFQSEKKQFGMHFFTTKFERDNRCTLTFIPGTEISDESVRLYSEYIDQFKLHWKEFLEWRK